jgi:hypothetical protein
LLVIPAKAGIQVVVAKAKMDSGFRRNDAKLGSSESACRGLIAGVRGVKP